MVTRYRNVACCIDQSPSALLVMEEGRAMRELDPTIALHLVHVARPPAVRPAGPYTYVEPSAVRRAEARRWLDDRLAEVPGATGVLLDGNPSKAVCRWAAQAGVDLLIVAPHHGAFDRAVHGDFAGDVAYRAPCPVLIVRPSPAPG